MKYLFLILNLFISFPAFSLVDMINGNYSESWTDLSIPGVGYDLEIKRTYNSKSSFDGMFGYGWCSPYETSLRITAEGNIKLTECGAGQELYFSQSNLTRKQVDMTIGKIIAKMKAAEKGDEKVWGELSRDMLLDESLRAQFAQSYKVLTPIKEGGIFFLNGHGWEYISYKNDIYTRNKSDGNMMDFDQSGRLLKIYDKNNNFVKINYADKKIISISTNNHKLSFDYNLNNKVKSAKWDGDGVIQYTYYGNNLSSSRNSKGDTHRYYYDDQHNLMVAIFPDNSFAGLFYDKENDWVTNFVSRDKCIEHYSYRTNLSASAKKICGLSDVKESTYSFISASDQDGLSFLSQISYQANGSSSDITYNQDGNPLVIKNKDNTYTFAYNHNGQFRSKKSNPYDLSYEYDSASGKITKTTVSSHDESGKILSASESNFIYDKKGNIIYVKNSDGRSIVLAYNKFGAIDAITTHDKIFLKILYDPLMGKPSRITVSNLGSMQISYKENGDIDKVNSPDGSHISMKVGEIFNNLLDMLSPATADLYDEVNPEMEAAVRMPGFGCSQCEAETASNEPALKIKSYDEYLIDGGSPKNNDSE